MMKKIVFIITVLGLITATNAQIKIDTSKSIVKWTGSNLFKFNEHYGTVNFKKGFLLKDKDSITGGNFEIDMNSIVNTDGKYNEMLVQHLKNEDFFDVEKYPKAKLKIISVKYMDSINLAIKANLTIKSSTEPIAFKSTVENHGDKTILKSKFIIDRTRWNINYESKSVLDSLKDDSISDAIEFEVTIVTN